MQCYLCGSKCFKNLSTKTRDDPNINVLKCLECSLVFLDSFEHIRDDFYEQSKMRNNIDIKTWILETKEDDIRRYKNLKKELEGKDILDFGAGNGNFLKLSKKIAKSVTAIELDKESHQLYKKNKINFYSSIDDIPDNIKFDLITAFHVIEHLKDPISYLKDISKYLKDDGKIILEFPNSNDALLSLYESENFSNFTFWSCHLMLFNEETIKKVIQKSGLSCQKIIQYQRYPISNHLHWLSFGKPGGHKLWSFLDNECINKQYQKILTDLKMCDTLIVEVKKQ